MLVGAHQKGFQKFTYVKVKHVIGADIPTLRQTVQVQLDSATLIGVQTVKVQYRVQDIPHPPAVQANSVCKYSLSHQHTADAGTLLVLSIAVDQGPRSLFCLPEFEHTFPTRTLHTSVQAYCFTKQLT